MSYKLDYSEQVRLGYLDYEEPDVPEKGWFLYGWDEIDGEDGFFWERSEEELRKTVRDCKVFCYAIHTETKEVIKNDKPPHPDWIYMRERWGMIGPGDEN